MNRRSVLSGASVSLLLMPKQLCCAHANVRLLHSRGCLLAKADVPTVFSSSDSSTIASGDEQIYNRSDDHNFDLALAHTLEKIAKAFEVLPGFGYYDDSASWNAYATPVTRINNVDGTVLMGREFTKWLMQRPESPEVAVAGVCAHEFGHIVQFKHGLIEKVNAGQSTVKRSELQADFFAGYFAGLRKSEKPDYPAAVVALTQYNVGDTDFTNVQHHGTPEERGAAVVKGFEAALFENRTLAEAIAISTNYVTQL